MNKIVLTIFGIFIAIALVVGLYSYIVILEVKEDTTRELYLLESTNTELTAKIDVLESKNTELDKNISLLESTNTSNYVSTNKFPPFFDFSINAKKEEIDGKN